MTLFSRVLYTVIAFALLGASIVLIGVAVWRTSQGFWTGEGALDTMLDGIGLVIIAVAVVLFVWVSNRMGQPWLNPRFFLHVSMTGLFTGKTLSCGTKPWVPTLS